jgi:carboxymethylenebutenolidase
VDQKVVDQLVRSFRSGQMDRRDFLKRATVVLGGAAAANALLLAANGAPFADVVRAAGQVDQAATQAATAAPTPTQVTADIETSMITFKGGTDDAPGYLARPKGNGPFPAVVVIQEWWGLDDHIKNVTERFAHQGFVALAPDLYRGVVAKEPNDAQRLVMQVQMDQALKDIQGAVNYLIAQKTVTPAKAGIVGFCFGGGLAMMMAYKGENVGAVASFYGSSANPSAEDIKNVKAPVIGFYGELDQGTPVNRIKGWQDSFKAAGKINEMTIYKGAQHAFFNDTRASYNKDAAQDAWIKTLAWFLKYLVDAPATPEAMAPATSAATPATP